MATGPIPLASGPIKNPMPPIPANDIYRVRFQGTIEGCMTINTLYYRDSDPDGTANRTKQIALAGLLLDPAPGVANDYKACCVSSWTFDAILIDVPTTPTLNTYIVFPVLTGTVAGAHAPNQMAVTMTKETLHRGKHGRSRISLPAVPLTWVTGSQVTNMTAYNTLANVLLQPIDDGTHFFTPTLLSVTYKTTPPSYGFADLYRLSAKPILGTARRRKLGRGS